MRLRIGVFCAFILAGALAAGPLKADSISIQNASFENTAPLTFAGCGTGCAYNFGQIPDWTLNGTGGSFQPGSTYYNSLPDGSIVAFSSGGSISQALAVSLLPDTTYTLSVDVGHRLDGFGSGTGFSISLDAGSTLLSAIGGSSSTITPGTFQEETLTYTTGSTVTPGDLSIILGSGFGQSNFDDVRLTTSSTAESVPEPSALLLLCMGLFCLALFLGCSGRKSQLNGAAS